MRRAVLLAGPTASGKSALALDLARRVGGMVVNADSMQVYAELRILTARPNPEEEAEAPHRLYGHVPASERYSVGRWLDDIAATLAEAAACSAVPIVVGGTGLYFKALTEGLAPVPPIPDETREKWRERSEKEGAASLHRLLGARDPEGAAAIEPADRARVVRALEVIDATGRPLTDWQRERAVEPLIAIDEAECLVLMPDRAALTETIDRRFAAMVECGGLDEAAGLAALGLDPDLPAMKAIGVRPLIEHAAGRISLDMAVRKAGTETRRYAKRQMTWFRNQMPDWTVVSDPAKVDRAAIVSRLGREA